MVDKDGKLIVNQYEVSFFNCGHKVSMSHEQMTVEVAATFYRFGSVSQAHCPLCQELDAQAQREETVRRMEGGLL